MHDDLITDSYLDQTERACAGAGLKFSRMGLEGRNHRGGADEHRRGGCDMLVLGAQGLGAVQPGVLGTVCGRVVRLTTVDTLVIKNAQRRIGKGAILVALGGSHQSHGGLLTAVRRPSSLLLVGKRGIHAAEGLDIGGNTEHLLRVADCNVLVVQRKHVPDAEEVAPLRPVSEPEVSPTEDALRRLERVPEGFMRVLTRQRIEVLARERGEKQVIEETVDEKFEAWTSHSAGVVRGMAWEEEATRLIAAAPAMVQGMVIREIEAGAQRAGLARITADPTDSPLSAPP